MENYAPPMIRAIEIKIEATKIETAMFPFFNSSGKSTRGALNFFYAILGVVLMFISYRVVDCEWIPRAGW